MTQPTSLVKKLTQLIQPIITTLGYELWGCVIHGAGKYTVVRVYIETLPDAYGKVNPISLEDCSKVSNEVSAVIDVEDLIQSGYNLEVSSPGLDRQLFTREHYQRFIGNMISLKLLLNLNGRKNYKGILEAVDDDMIKLNEDNVIIEVPLAHIDKANIVPKF